MQNEEEDFFPLPFQAREQESLAGVRLVLNALFFSVSSPYSAPYLSRRAASALVPHTLDDNGIHGMFCSDRRKRDERKQQIWRLITKPSL